MSEAFSLPLGRDRFQATELTQGPWDPGLQHAGPPAALLGRAVERHWDRAGLQVARVTFEILRPLPIAELVPRPGCCGAGAASSWSRRPCWPGRPR